MGFVTLPDVIYDFELQTAARTLRSRVRILPCSVVRCVLRPWGGPDVPSRPFQRTSMYHCCSLRLYVVHFLPSRSQAACHDVINGRQCPYGAPVVSRDNAVTSLSTVCVLKKTWCCVTGWPSVLRSGHCRLVTASCACA